MNHCSDIFMSQTKKIIVGMGNSILGDDGLGCYITSRLQQENLDYQIVTSPSSGFNLADHIIEKDQAVFIDSIITGKHNPGDVITYCLKDFKSCQPFSIHSTDLANAIQLYQKFNIPIPSQILFIAVEVKDNYTFKENFSPEISENIDHIYNLVKFKIFDFFSCTNRVKEYKGGING